MVSHDALLRRRIHLMKESLTQESLAMLFLMGYKKITFIYSLFSNSNRVHLLKPGTQRTPVCGTRANFSFADVFPLTEGRPLNCMKCLRHVWKLRGAA